MQGLKRKIKLIKKSDKEGQRALAIAAMNQLTEYAKPLYFAKHWT